MLDRKEENITKKEKILLDLTNGNRRPKNSREKQLLKEINTIKKKGRIVEIPFNGL